MNNREVCHIYKWFRNRYELIIFWKQRFIKGIYDFKNVKVNNLFFEK